MNDYRIDKKGLFNEIAAWDGLFKKKVQIIACGGTAMTLLDIKESTKDIDFMVPKQNEFDYLIKVLQQAGYYQGQSGGWQRDAGFRIDFFTGNKIHTTELMESPLQKNNHLLIKQYGYIYLGILNYYDLIISKLFRGSTVDFQDCLLLFRKKREEININVLKTRFHKTSSFDISEDKVNKHLDSFLRMLNEDGLKNG